MSQSSSIDRVVVLGGGYAGLRAAMDLAAACHRHGLKRRLKLVDRTKYHQLVTHLHRAATEGIGLESCRLSLDDLLVPGSVERRRGKILGLDPRARTIHLDEGPPMPYDRLIIALGSVPAAPGIDGLKDHGFRLRWWRDAERLREHVRRTFAEAGAQKTAQGRGELLTLAVVGGGATGCQLVGELTHWLPRLADEHQIPVEEIRLILVESDSSLLQELGPESSGYARTILERKGVEVLSGTPLVRVGAASIFLGDGSSVATRTVVWTGGVQAPALLREAGLPTGDQGRVPVDARLRVSGHPEIYVAGDASLVEHRGQALPATAAVAQHQGAFVATAIVSEMLGRTMSEYRPRDVGKLVSLGGDEAVGSMLGLPLQGSGAGFVKENIERWYESTITRRLPLVDL